MFEAQKYLVPADAHSIEQKDMLSQRIMFLLRYLGIQDSMSNRIELEDRLVQRYALLYGRSNLLEWRICQLTNQELTDIVCNPVSELAIRAVKRSQLLKPVLVH